MIAAIDLFAGAGGLSIGARAAGIHVAVHVDNDPDCCETLRRNKRWNAGTVVQADVSELSGDQLRRAAGVSRFDPVMIIGGAPCQPFSKAAYWIESGAEAAYRRARAQGIIVAKPAAPRDPRPDSRRDLIREYWRLVVETKATAFVFENVPSILHPRNRQLADWLIKTAQAARFHTVLVRANAVEYGVAQKRERVFVLGAKAKRPNPPNPTHSTAEGRVAGLKKAVSAERAIRGLDTPAFAEAEEVVVGRWASHLRTIPPGGNYKAHTAWAGHPNPSFETETRFWSFLLKLHPDRPSWTIPANPGPWVGPFHWDSRRLRTPELAALQGFPRSYSFVGSRRSRVRQIGNAVPPPLGRRMVEAVAAALSSSTRFIR